MFKGFDERLATELRASIPLELELNVTGAGNRLLDAWKGAAQWAKEPGYKTAAVTREEYLEKGSEYLKEHNLGNAAMY